MNQKNIYVMDALRGFYQLNLPKGFELFLSSRVFLLALFGKATVVLHEECKPFLEPYFVLYPELETSLLEYRPFPL